MRTILQGGRLIDGTGAEPMDAAVVVIDGDRIVAVDTSSHHAPRRDDRIIDIDGRTIMPGLIDCHTHLTYHTVEPNVWVLEQVESVELNTLRAADNAAHVLDCGFTSIGDGGCRGFIAPAIRDAIREGLIRGPDVCAAGPILCGLGGLLDNDPAWVRRDSAGSLAMIVTGAEEVRRAVRMQIKGGVDWIKVAASGVAGSRFNSSEHEDLNEEEIATAVAEAAKFGKRVHAHAHSTNGVQACINAGVVSMHCAEFANEEQLIAMRDKAIPFSPTLAWLQARCMDSGNGVAHSKGNDNFLSEAWKAYDAAREIVRAAHSIGTPLAIGSDAFHRFPHVRDGVVEMEYLVALGYTPLEAIRSATQVAAQAIDPETDRGVVKVGARADLLVVDGDPASDLSVLRDKSRIHHLFKAGIEQMLPAGRGRTGLDFDVAQWAHRDLAQTCGERVGT
ncbi:MAG: imidazolonepropionase-like amidohydrolase [Gammaproteobacteria bacterium]|jgi:imidazolonepropionase-like amidohydrolase